MEVEQPISELDQATKEVNDIASQKSLLAKLTEVTEIYINQLSVPKDDLWKVLWVLGHTIVKRL